jgi:hypothetical protein
MISAIDEYLMKTLGPAECRHGQVPAAAASLLLALEIAQQLPSLRAPKTPMHLQQPRATTALTIVHVMKPTMEWGLAARPATAAVGKQLTSWRSRPQSTVHHGAQHHSLRLRSMSPSCTPASQRPDEIRLQPTRRGAATHLNHISMAHMPTPVTSSPWML